MYTGIAVLKDGKIVTVHGTIQECANWADNIIRENHEEIKIDIRRKD
jgi:hypothetical protein